METERKTLGKAGDSHSQSKQEEQKQKQGKQDQAKGKDGGESRVQVREDQYLFCCEFLWVLISFIYLVKLV